MLKTAEKQAHRSLLFCCLYVITMDYFLKISSA